MQDNSAYIIIKEELMERHKLDRETCSFSINPEIMNKFREVCDKKEVHYSPVVSDLIKNWTKEHKNDED